MTNVNNMKRTHKIEIRVSEAEKAAIIEKASGLSLSDYLRGLALPENCHDKPIDKCHDKVESVMTDTENVMTNDRTIAESVMTSLDSVMTTIDPVMTSVEPQNLSKALQISVKQAAEWSGGYGKNLSAK